MIHIQAPMVTLNTLKKAAPLFSLAVPSKWERQSCGKTILLQSLKTMMSLS